MSAKQKGERDKEKEKAEWMLALEFPEKGMLEGMKEICNNMEEFWCSELENTKQKFKIGELKQEVSKTSQRIQQLEGTSKKIEKELQLVKEQNKELSKSVTLLECKVMESCIRLRGIPEDEEENIYKLVVEKVAHFLEEQPEEISFNFQDIYKLQLC